MLVEDHHGARHGLLAIGQVPIFGAIGVAKDHIASFAVDANGLNVVRVPEQQRAIASGGAEPQCPVELAERILHFNLSVGAVYLKNFAAARVFDGDLAVTSVQTDDLISGGVAQQQLPVLSGATQSQRAVNEPEDLLDFEFAVSALETQRYVVVDIVNAQARPQQAQARPTPSRL